MKKLVAIIFNIGVVALFVWQIVNFYQLQLHLNKRALIVIVDSSNYMVPEAVDFYNKNKSKILPILSGLFGVDKREIENLEANQIVEIYGNEWMGKNILTQANGYKEKIFLNRTTANIEELKKNISNNNKKGLITDVVIIAHGNNDYLLLNDQIYLFEEIYQELNPITINMGFVYLSSCYGMNQAEMWKNLGAQAVNGSTAVNNFPIFAPREFMKGWVHGDSFEIAVTEGTDYEINFWKITSRIFPDAKKWISDESISGSKMNFVGNKNLTVFDD